MAVAVGSFSVSSGSVLSLLIETSASFLTDVVKVSEEDSKVVLGIKFGLPCHVSVVKAVADVSLVVKNVFGERSDSFDGILSRWSDTDVVNVTGADSGPNCPLSL